jgi:hypothetical protein
MPPPVTAPSATLVLLSLLVFRTLPTSPRLPFPSFSTSCHLTSHIKLPLPSPLRPVTFSALPFSSSSPSPFTLTSGEVHLISSFTPPLHLQAPSHRLIRHPHPPLPHRNPSLSPTTLGPAPVVWLATLGLNPAILPPPTRAPSHLNATTTRRQVQRKRKLPEAQLQPRAIRIFGSIAPLALAAIDCSVNDTYLLPRLVQLCHSLSCDLTTDICRS